VALDEGLIAGSFFDFDAQAFDLLVQGGEGDFEVFGGLGLVPVAAFEAIRDDAAFDLLHEVEEGGVGLMIEKTGRVGATGELGRE